MTVRRVEDPICVETEIDGTTGLPQSDERPTWAKIKINEVTESSTTDLECIIWLLSRILDKLEARSS